MAALDVELCDCFLDYGEAWAEMFLLLTFVAFGAGLIWTGVTLAGDWRVLVFAAVALGIRGGVLIPVLARSGIEPESCRLIALFGPRGLSSLLLVLLPVFAGIPGAERLFTITCLVVLLSVVIHGGGIAIYLRRHGGAAAGAPTPGAAPAPNRAEVVPSAATAAAAAGRGTVGPGRKAARAAETNVPEKITIPEFPRCSRPASRSSSPTSAPSGATATTQHGRGRDPAPARRRRPPGARATIGAARHARPVLCVTGRSHKRPGGARASSSGMEEGAGAGRGVGGVAGGRTAGGAGVRLRRSELTQHRGRIRCRGGGPTTRADAGPGGTWSSSDQLLDHPGQFREDERLPDQREIAIAGEQVARLGVAGRGHEHHHQARIEVERALGQFAAVHPGHPEIDQEQASLPGVRIEEAEGRPAAEAVPGVVAKILEHAGDGVVRGAPRSRPPGRGDREPWE